MPGPKRTPVGCRCAVSRSSVSIGEDEGCGVRVIADGAWGFAAPDRLDADSLDRTAALAVRCARASARHSPGSIALAPQAPARGSYRTPVRVDPFAVSIEAK